MSNRLPSKQNTLWHLINALQRVVGGGVCKKVTLVAYFDAHGNCISREEIRVTKLYPSDFFNILMKSMEEAEDG